jgi:hypothetical protein
MHASVPTMPSLNLSAFSRVLKNDFSTTFSCKKPNDFDGRFSKHGFFNTLLALTFAFRAQPA